MLMSSHCAKKAKQLKILDFQNNYPYFPNHSKIKFLTIFVLKISCTPYINIVANGSLTLHQLIQFQNLKLTINMVQITFCLSNLIIIQMNYSCIPIYFLPCGSQTINLAQRFPQNNYYSPYFQTYPINFNSQIIFENCSPLLENRLQIQPTKQLLTSSNSNIVKDESEKSECFEKSLFKKEEEKHQKNKEDKQIKRKYNQNPKRNVITNIGNQILSYVGNKFKLYLLLLKISEKVEEQTISSLLIYIRKIRKQVNSYLNVQKMRRFWFSSNGTPEEVLRLFRKISFYYLTTHLHLKTIKSSKMKNLTRMHHLGGIRELITILKSNIVTSDDFDI